MNVCWSWKRALISQNMLETKYQVFKWTKCFFDLMHVSDSRTVHSSQFIVETVHSDAIFIVRWGQCKTVRAYEIVTLWSVVGLETRTVLVSCTHYGNGITMDCPHYELRTMHCPVTPVSYFLNEARIIYPKDSWYIVVVLVQIFQLRYLFNSTNLALYNNVLQR